MRDQFTHFYVPDEDATAAAMKTGLVVPDTNVLLNLYRFQTAARDQLFGALEDVSDRLWIPYQVGLEFQRNRLSVMKEQEEYFDTTLRDLHTALEDFRSKVRAFKRRLSLRETDIHGIEQAISGVDDLIGIEIVKGKESNEIWLGGHAQDEVLARIDALFEGRVGEPMKPEVLEAARKEGQRRVTDKIPPGYKDRDKSDSTGDYIVWRQLMTEAANRKLPVIFVTDDTKEDWVRREHGLTLGARPELREEMNREAGVPLFMLTTETFLRYAKTYLGTEVSDETVDQARDFTVHDTGPLHPANTSRILGWNTLAGVTADKASLVDADELLRLVEVSPSAAVMEAFARIERRLVDLLEEDGTSPDRKVGAATLARTAFTLGLISNETRDAVEGLSILRNLAAHGPKDDISTERALDYVVMADAVLYTLRQKPSS
jgi:rRNA-processing protein FCF1